VGGGKDFGILRAIKDLEEKETTPDVEILKEKEKKGSSSCSSFRSNVREKRKGGRGIK